MGFVSAKTLIGKLFERTCTSVRCVARFSFDFLFNLRHFLAIFLWPVWLNLTYSGLGRKISFSRTKVRSQRDAEPHGQFTYKRFKCESVKTL